MINRMLKPGITLEQKRIVRQGDAITFLGPDVPPSLSTPSMIAWMETACRDAVLPHLEPGQDTVGTKVNIEHFAGIPRGEEVTYRAELAAVDGRRLTFRVQATAGDKTVGSGTHERFLIDIERFAAGVKKRAGGAS